MTMRERFVDVATSLLDEDERLAIVLAEISAGNFRASGAIGRHPDRVVNVGIREQLMIGFAAGMAAAGYRPVAHSYTPFLIERPYEQIKLDFSHQGLGGILVSTGASYDAAAAGRTHQSPGDVALMRALPDWEIIVPGHPDEAESALRNAARSDGRTYIRLSDGESNHAAVPGEGISAVRIGSRGAPTVLAIGPTLDQVIAAVSDIDVTVLYTSRPRPLDGTGLAAGVTGMEVILAEPYLEGTSAAAVSAVLGDRPCRLLSIGVANIEHRKYGTSAEHRAAHGLDAEGIRRRIQAFLSG